jgi:hypothetical protein
MSDLLEIRNRMLSSATSINVFVLIKYNRNQTRNSDSWFMQISVRDYFAQPSQPGIAGYHPPPIIVYETPKVGSLYPVVVNPLAAGANFNGTQFFELDMRHLYFPEQPPILNPPLPASFRVDAEEIRRTIIRERPP